MLFNGPGCQQLKNAVQELKEREAKLAQPLPEQDSPLSAPRSEKGTLSSLPTELQSMIFENLDSPYLQRDRANFIAAVPSWTCYLAYPYPVDQPYFYEIINDLLFLFSPFNRSTESLSLAGKIVKFRPFITKALNELTPQESIKIANRVLDYLILFSSCKEDLDVMNGIYDVHGNQFFNVVYGMDVTRFTNFITEIIEVTPSINKQKDSSYFRHILVLILLSFLSSSFKESLNKERQKQIGAITSLNLSPLFPFLLLTEYNHRVYEPLYKPLPIYTLIFNAELRFFSKNNRSDYKISPVWPILVNQKFSNINFTGRNLSYVTFFKVEFLNVSFANAKLKNATFIDCKFSNVSFNSANLTEAALAGINLTGADLTGAKLAYAKLEEVNLTEAVLNGADLTNAYLPQANLTGAVLNGAVLIHAYLLRAVLRRTRLVDADLTQANLTKADLKGADLTRSVLIEANLTEANLTGADLDWAKLCGTKFTRADLREAKLTHLDYPPILWR